MRDIVDLTMNKQIDLTMFSRFKFRMKFKLDKKDSAFVEDKGISTIENQKIQSLYIPVPEDSKQLSLF